MGDSPSQHKFDVAIVGAGPAGATAAGLLAAKERSVALIDTKERRDRQSCTGWLSGNVEEFLKALQLSNSDVGAVGIEDVTFFSADFSKSAKPNFTTPPGYVVDRVLFDQRLTDVARTAGTVLFSGQSVTALDLGESHITATLASSDRIQADILILATGRNSPLIQYLRTETGALQSAWYACQVEGDVAPAQDKASVSIVLGLDSAGGYGIAVCSGNRASVGIQSAAASQSIPTALGHLCRVFYDQGVVSVDLSGSAPKQEAVMTPTAVAISMETHVAKRTLIIGDAGGFVSAMSGEGVMPAMWSARIAASLVNEALDSPSPQDVLMRFNTEWRTEMAEYLRLPNTELQYVVPLVFTNQPMADRMGEAFFCGKSI